MVTILDHSVAPDVRIGWSRGRYYDGQRRPLIVVDTARDVSLDADRGPLMSGMAVDFVFDGFEYIGISAPFVLPAITADLIVAYESTADVSVDYVVAPDGGRTTAPTDDYVIGDDFIWSIGI